MSVSELSELNKTNISSGFEESWSKSADSSTHRRPASG